MTLTRAALLRKGAGLALALALPKLPGKAPAVVRNYNYESITRTPMALDTVFTAPQAGLYFMQGDLLRDEFTGENMLVTAVSDHSLTLCRNLERRMWLGEAA